MAEHIRRVLKYEMTRLRTVAAAMREDGRDGIAGEYTSRADVVERHLNHLAGVKNATINGSALGDHAERVADWLIDNGWTPPEGVLLLAEADDSDDWH